MLLILQQMKISTEDPIHYKRLAPVSAKNNDESNYKRLASSKDVEENTTNDSSHFPAYDIHIIQYSPKCIVVYGDVLKHSNALLQLGGKYNCGLDTMRVPMGKGYIYSKFRQEIVEHYIQTGEIKKFEYDEKTKQQFQKKKIEENSTIHASGKPTSTTKSRMWSLNEIRSILKEMREAFEDDGYYQGDSIIDVIDQIEEKYLPKPKIIKASKK